MAIALVLGVYRTSFCYCALIISRILIPECVRLTPIIDISLNTGIICILIVLIIRDLFLKRVVLQNALSDFYVKRLLIVLLCFGFVLFLSCYDNLSFQIKMLNQFAVAEVLPAILMVVSLRNEKDFKIILWTFFVSTLICCVYAIYTLIIDRNPYVGVINLLYSKRDFVLTLGEELDYSRGFAGTSSTFEFANGFGYFIPVTFSLMFFFYQIKKTMLKLILLLLLSICVIICTKRSAIVAYVVFWIIYWLYSSRKQKKKILLFFVSMIFVAIFLIYSIPQLSSVQGLLESSIFFWNDDMKIKNDIHGSSFSMRVEQVLYPFVLVADNFLFGKGFGSNTISNVSASDVNLVSENQTDFIFSVIGEEFGFVGCVILIVIFACLVYQCMNVAKKSGNLIGTYVAVGVACYMGFQSFINIAVATGTMPNTGQPLPFISYGLSSLMSASIAIGMVLNIYLQRKRH